MIEIIILIVAIFLSGFFSGIEAAFFSVSSVQVKNALNAKRNNAKTLDKLKRDPHRFIITNLIGNNVVNILAASLATKIAIDKYGDIGIGIATGAMTLIILIVGEIVPKAYCSKRALTVSLFAAPIIYGMSIVLKPIIFVLEKITKAILFVFGVKETHSHKTITEQGLIDIISIGEQEGTLNKTESEFMKNVLEFDDTIVEESMIPREHVISVSTTDSNEVVLKKMIDSGYSRLPVMDKRNTHVLGIIFIKDLIKDMNAPLKTLIVKPLVVPETKKISMLLKTFQKKQTHMAIVVNEYGGYEGIITLEDCLEEIIGDVYDETDVEVEYIKKIRKGIYSVRADTEIEDFNKSFRTKIPLSDEYETIAGFVLKMIGRVPNKGENITIGRLTFTPTLISHNRIVQFRVRR